MCEFFLETLANDNTITGVFTLLGAGLGFFSNAVLSKIQTKKEIAKKRYEEKERLYADIISFLPQVALAIDTTETKIHLSNKDILMLNSFKARLLIYSTDDIYNDFYQLVDDICDDKSVSIEKIAAFDKRLVQDLRNSFAKV